LKIKVAVEIGEKTHRGIPSMDCNHEVRENQTLRNIEAIDRNISGMASYDKILLDKRPIMMKIKV
jgi:hypothetical protein